MTRADIVAEARSWIGTPFVHQGRVKGAGVDCAGHVASVVIALGALAESWRVELAKLSRYGTVPRGDAVLQILGRLMCRVEGDPGDGDVLVLRFRSQAQHIGIRGTSSYGAPTLIHALRGDGASAVVEHRISASWSRRIEAAYRFAGLVG